MPIPTFPSVSILVINALKILRGNLLIYNDKNRTYNCYLPHFMVPQILLDARSNQFEVLQNLFKIKHLILVKGL